VSPSAWLEAHVAALKGRRDELASQRDSVPRSEDPEHQADRQARVEELGLEIVALQDVQLRASVWQEDMERSLERATKREIGQ
jgi:hypothetical protein